MIDVIDYLGRHSRAAALATAAAVAAGGVWAVGIGPSAAAPAASSDPSNISLARGTAVPENSMSARERQAFSSARGLLKLNLGAVHAAGNGVWLTSGDGKSCVFVDDGEGIGGGCATTSATEQGKLAFDVRSTTSDERTLTGVVPDGVRTVTARDAAGAVVDSSAVHNNAYQVHGSGIRALELTGDGSPITIPES